MLLGSRRHQLLVRCNFHLALQTVLRLHLQQVVGATFPYFPPQPGPVVVLVSVTVRVHVNHHGQQLRRRRRVVDLSSKLITGLLPQDLGAALRLLRWDTTPRDIPNIDEAVVLPVFILALRRSRIIFRASLLLSREESSFRPRWIPQLRDDCPS